MLSKGLNYNKVNSGQLLQSLECTACELTLQNRWFEAIDVRGLSEGLFVVVVRPDLGDLSLDGRMIGTKTTDL